MAFELFKDREAPVCGGIVDKSDLNAPKQITSQNIVYFNAYFYVESNSEPSDYAGRYSFQIANGVLSENKKWNLSEQIDENVLYQLQALIDKYELVKLNGTDRHTAGLPPEYQPCFFDVKYDCNEKLYFSMNNNPNALWARELVNIFRDFFVKTGHISEV